MYFFFFTRVRARVRSPVNLPKISPITPICRPPKNITDTPNIFTSKKYRRYLRYFVQIRPIIWTFIQIDLIIIEFVPKSWTFRHYLRYFYDILCSCMSSDSKYRRYLRYVDLPKISPVTPIFLTLKNIADISDMLNSQKYRRYLRYIDLPKIPPIIPIFFCTSHKQTWHFIMATQNYWRQ